MPRSPDTVEAGRTAAKRQRERRLAEERERKARLAASKAARAKLKAGGAKVGRKEEDGSFRVGRGSAYDPETRKVRTLKPEDDKRSPDAREPTTKRERKEIKREQISNARKRAAAKLEKAGLHDEARQVRAGAPLTRDFASRIGDDLQSAAIGFPGGVYQIAKAVTKDVSDIGHGRVGRRQGRKPFGRTGGIAEQIGRQYAKDYRHPIRHAQQHPGFFGLDVFAALSAGAGTASRVGAAGRAAKEASAAGRSPVAAALTRPSHKGGSLLKKPLPETRTHTYKGQPIRGRYSTNPAVRAVQRRADARGKDIGVTKAERLLSEERRVTDAAAKAPGLRAMSVAPKHRSTTDLLRRFGIERSGTVEDAAIRVAAEGVPIDDVIEAHVRAASQIEKRIRNKRKGGVPGGGYTTQTALRLDGQRRELLRRAAIYEEARKYLDVDDDGAPRVTPELQEKYDITQQAALTRESRAKRTGLLTLEAAERRKNAPGEMTRRTVSGGRAVKVERPRTVAEAQARADQLEAKLNKGLDSMARDIAPDFWSHEGGAGPTRRVSELDKGDFRRGLYNRRRRDMTVQGDALETWKTRGPAQHATKFSEARRWLENKIITEAAKPDGHPVYKSIAAEMEELADLKAALAAEKERGTFAEGLTTGGSLGKVEEFKGLEEIEPFNAGKFRVPDVLRSKRLPHGPLAYRGGVPRKPGTFTHEYTGALRREGKATPHTIRAVAEDALEFERYASAERLRQRLLPMGSKVRPPDTRRVKYVPLKERDLTRGESASLRKMLEEVDPETLTPDEAARIEDAVKAWERELFPEVTDYANVRVGQAQPGVVWVDRRLLGSQRKFIGRLPVIDAASDVVKGLILYGKPGYVAPNVLGNIGFNLFQQGFLAPRNWARSVRLKRDLDFMVKEIMGSGYAHALAEGTESAASFAVHKAGNFWSKFVDDPFRKASFLHEARRYGFKTDDELRDLILNPSHRSQLGEIAQRARDAIIDYERMGPVERDLVRRVLFVYPWLKGSTYYAGQFLRDHPIQAAVFARIGQEGESQALEELGPMPAWARGSFKVGGTEDQPQIVNPNSVSPFSTPAQMLQMLSGVGRDVERSEQIGEATNPILQSAIEAGFHRDLFTGRQLEGGYGQVFLEQLGKGLPQTTLYRRGGLNFIPGIPDQHVSPDATYPYTPADAREQFVFGSAFPRPANRQKLNEQAVQAVTPADKAKREVGRERDDLVELFRQKAPGELLKGEKLPPVLESAFTRRTNVETLRKRVEAEYKEPGVDRERAKFVGEIAILGRWGAIPKKEVAQATKWAKGASWDDLKDARAYLTDNELDDAYLGVIRDSRKYLEGDE